MKTPIKKEETREGAPAVRRAEFVRVRGGNLAGTYVRLIVWI